MKIRDLLSGPPPWNRSCKSYRAVDKPWNRFGPAVPYPEGEKRNLELASYLSDATLASSCRQRSARKPVQIRPATAADIPCIMNLERQSDTAGHWTEEQYRHACQRDGATRFVLLAEGLESSPAGFLVAQHLPPEWELENIVVAPTSRRKGFGTRLLDSLLDAAKKTNSTAVFLEVRESNAPARTLYERTGFEQSGRRKSYYTNPSEDAVLYRLTLP